ncbi:hypothetical protein LINGRAHAP2_LOCUS7635 [Linum grandiflorum]
MDCIVSSSINCTMTSAWMTGLLRVTYPRRRLGVIANGGIQWASYVGIHSPLCIFKLPSAMISSAPYQTRTYYPGGPEGHVVLMHTYTWPDHLLGRRRRKKGMYVCMGSLGQ